MPRPVRFAVVRPTGSRLRSPALGYWHSDRTEEGPRADAKKELITDRRRVLMSGNAVKDALAQDEAVIG
ncbi:MAG: hypothetical protein ACLFU7_08940, partial [Armatimonadota bacterium]